MVARTMTNVVMRGLPTVMRALTGFGDYHVSSNTLMKGGMSPPEVVNSLNSGSFIVRHREYVTDILSTEAFFTQTFTINPGLLNTFPWLSAIAANFEQYKIRGMVWEYKSTSSNAVLSTDASTALGTVIMATTYNPNTTDFGDKRTMENYQYASSFNPSKTGYHPIECARGQTPVTELYVRTGAVPEGQDARLYDLGNTVVATTGMQANGGVIGELWCSFEVELLKPKLLSTRDSSVLSAKFHSTTITDGLPFLGSTPNPGNTMSMVVTGSVIAFPPTIFDGFFFVSMLWVGTSVTLAWTGFEFTDCAPVNSFQGNTMQLVIAPPIGATSTEFTIQFILEITSEGAVIEAVGSDTLPLGGTFDLHITQIAPLDNALDSSDEEPDQSLIDYALDAGFTDRDEIYTAWHKMIGDLKQKQQQKPIKTTPKRTKIKF